jgi:formylglycine-generating enzyme required for sulfatase activity
MNADNTLNLSWTSGLASDLVFDVVITGFMPTGNPQATVTQQFSAASTTRQALVTIPSAIVPFTQGVSYVIVVYTRTATSPLPIGVQATRTIIYGQLSATAGELPVVLLSSGAGLCGSSPQQVTATGDIATAAAFTLINLPSLSTPYADQNAGFFYGINAGQVVIPSLTFTLNGAGNQINDAVFGTFTPTFVAPVSNTSDGTTKTRVIDVYGNYSNTYTQTDGALVDSAISQLPWPAKPTARGLTSPNPVSARFRVTLQQTVAAGSAFQTTAVLKFPVIAPTPTPTPTPTNTPTRTPIPTATPMPVVAPLKNPLTFIDIYDAGNPPSTRDAAAGLGQVNYPFKMSKFETTVAQYADFLNAVAKTDTNNLYNLNMGICGITRVGASGAYKYIADPARVNRPVAAVTWASAARFVNWLHNGMYADPATTEYGAYTLTPATTVGVPRNTGARYWIPNPNEWYKAAFYNPTLNNGLGGYTKWQTNSEIEPVATANTATANASNWRGVLDDTLNVGSYSNNSTSFYGMHDALGNVRELGEGVNPNNPVVAMSFANGYASTRMMNADTLPYSTLASDNSVDFRQGFRVAADAATATFVYGIDNAGIVWQTNLSTKIATQVLNTQVTGPSNGLAFDSSRQHLFMFGATAGDLYYWNMQPNPMLSNQKSKTGILPLINLPVTPTSAAYYNNAIWFFFPTTPTYTGPRTSRDLVKIVLDYTYGYPRVWDLQIFATDVLPTVDNRFGDISVDMRTGLLYATTNTGMLYTIDLNSPTNSFNLIKTGLNGFQNSFDLTFTQLYLHSTTTGEWQVFTPADKKITPLNFKTSVTPGNTDGVGFRDIAGPNYKLTPIT